MVLAIHLVLDHGVSALIFYPLKKKKSSREMQLEAECPIPRNLKSGVGKVFKLPKLLLLIEI